MFAHDPKTGDAVTGVPLGGYPLKAEVAMALIHTTVVSRSQEGGGAFPAVSDSLDGLTFTRGRGL